MKVLITGFDPFGGESINPALEAVKLLPENISGAEVIKLEIPTVFRKSLAKIEEAIEKHNPDILVITGHDALTSRKGNITDLNNYRNSLNFIKAVKQARKWEPNLDNLVIFAGACQSNYEQLIRAGANYASSPGRIMIHALDPVFVVEKIACSRIDTIVPIEEVIEQTVTGLKGIGGSETRGKFRWAMPKSMLY